RLTEQPVEANRAERAQHRDGVAVRQRAPDANPIRGDGDPALEQRAKALDQRGGPGGKIGQGALSDPAIIAKTFAQQDGRRRAAVGYRFNVHGTGFSTSLPPQIAKSSILHGYSPRQNAARPAENHAIYRLRSKNFGLATGVAELFRHQLMM